MRVDQSKLDRIKEIQLEMISELDSFCRANDIKYCLAYGTLLGAIRHNGYIPWDDDVDIWMTRDNFEKFSRLYVSENNKLCTLGTTENYPFRVPKLINKHTWLMEDEVKHVDFDYGVYLDIFVLDKLPKNKVIQELKLARFYMLYGQFRLKYRDTNNKLIKAIQRKINTTKIEMKQKKLWQKCNGPLYKDNCTIYFLWKHKANRRYKFNVDWFDEMVDHKFENLTCMIPKRYDDILKLCYGDYMQLPPENEREVHNYIEFEER